MASPLVGNGLDRRRLARPGGSVEHESKSIRNSLSVIPVTVLQEEASSVGNLIPLLEEDVLKITIGHELGLRVDKMSRWEGVLDGATNLRLDHLVEKVPVRAQLVLHAPFVVHVAVVDEGLEMLHVVIVAEEPELDNLELTVLDLEIEKLKEHILIKANGLELVWKIVMVSDGE
jgi:hypothetical protein